MRHVYVDEAGTSAKEPVSIVVGVVIQSDEPWVAVTDEMQSLFDRFVPPSIRKGYHFHAKDLFGGGRQRDIWEPDARWQLLVSMVSLPRRLKLPICFGMSRRNQAPDAIYELFCSKPILMKRHQVDHLMAFSLCIGQIDSYLRKYTPPREYATLVAEDERDMRRFLALLPRILEESPVQMAPSHLCHDVSDLTSELKNSGELFTCTKIADGIHFASKRDSQLLQIADACAFALRRWMAAESRGEELLVNLLNPLPKWMDYSGVAHFGTRLFQGHDS